MKNWPRRVHNAGIGVVAGALALAIAVALTQRGDTLTRTHCTVPNVLPSLSAVLGDNAVEQNVATVGIFVSTPLRAAGAVGDFWRRPKFGELAETLGALSVLLYWAELAALLVVVRWTSTGNFAVHKAAFELFAAFGGAYMVVLSVIFRERRQILLLVFYVLAIIGMVYFYGRHEQRCEPYMYSCFAACEYVLVGVNLTGHARLPFGRVGAPSKTRRHVAETVV